MSIAASAGAVGGSVFAVARVHSVAASPSPKPVNVPLLAKVSRVPYRPVPMRPASQVPVIAYHAMDDRCAPSQATCKSSPDYESVSAMQLYTELGWLYTHGYHTVTLDQYLEWLGNKRTLLPANPVLLTDDNGDSDFLLGAEPILWHFRFTVTAVIVTGFTDAATTGYCRPLVKRGGRTYNVQANCGGPNTWNATWPQLRALSPQVYNYALEAGPDGHFVQDYDKKCTVYYACKMPGESDRVYELRVLRDLEAGMAALTRELPGRVNTKVWTVPYSDLGYTCPNDACPEEVSTGPQGWLVSFAAVNFRAVFVQTAIRNGIQNEHFRYEVHNSTTLERFRQAISTYLHAGYWRRA